MKSGNRNFQETSGALQACNGTALPLHTLCNIERKSIDMILHNLLYVNLSIWYEPCIILGFRDGVKGICGLFGC